MKFQGPVCILLTCLAAASPAAARGGYEVVRAVFGEADGGALFSRDATSSTSLTRVAQDGSLAWEVEFAARGSDHRIVKAADGSYRLLLSLSTPSLIAVDAQGVSMWSHTLAPSAERAMVATLADGATLLSYATTFTCRARKLDALGMQVDDVELAARGAPMHAIATASHAVVACGEFLGGADTVVLVEPDLDIVTMSQAGCIGADTRMASLGGDRWVLATATRVVPAQVTFCSFEGKTFRHASTLDFDGTINFSGGHGDEASGRYVLVGTVREDGIETAVDLVYDDEANTAQSFVIRSVEPDTPFGASALDSGGRVLHSFTIAGEDVFRLELARPGESPQRTWLLPEATDDSDAAHPLMAGESPWAATPVPVLYNGVVSRFHRLVGVPLFASGFE